MLCQKLNYIYQPTSAPLETKEQQKQFQRELLQRLRKIMHPFYVLLFLLLYFRVVLYFLSFSSLLLDMKNKPAQKKIVAKTPLIA